MRAWDKKGISNKKIEHKTLTGFSSRIGKKNARQRLYN